MVKSSYEVLARRLAVEMGATIRNQNAIGVTVVRVAGQKQEFWIGSWPEIAGWLQRNRKGGRERGA